jgi:hypothetical protein
MNAGQAPLCRTCHHHNLPGYDRGHPSPCFLFRWIGHKHHAPGLASDGSTCEDFEPLSVPDDLAAVASIVAMAGLD